MNIQSSELPLIYLSPIWSCLSQIDVWLQKSRRLLKSSIFVSITPEAPDLPFKQLLTFWHNLRRDTFIVFHIKHAQFLCTVKFLIKLFSIYHVYTVWSNLVRYFGRWTCISLQTHTFCNFQIVESHRHNSQPNIFFQS